MNFGDLFTIAVFFNGGAFFSQFRANNVNEAIEFWLENPPNYIINVLCEDSKNNFNIMSLIIKNYFSRSKINLNKFKSVYHKKFCICKYEISFYIVLTEFN